MLEISCIYLFEKKKFSFYRYTLIIQTFDYLNILGYKWLQVDEIDERKHALLPENYKNLQQAVRF